MLLVAGYLSIDTVTDAAGRTRRAPGGAALYAALGARLAGAQVALAASVGSDYPPDWLDALAALGIRLDAVTARPERSRWAEIRYEPDGTRRSLHYDDPAWWRSTEVHGPDWPADLAGADWIVAAPVRVETLGRLVEGAAARGVPVLADTNEAFAATDRDAFLRAVAGLRVFAPSREESRILCPGLDDDAAAHSLARLGPAVFQKRGADGAVLVPAGTGTAAHLPAPPATPVDPTGAGDATAGALAGCLAAGLDLAEAGRRALLVGARTISAEGPAALGFAVGAA